MPRVQRSVGPLLTWGTAIAGTFAIAVTAHGASFPKPAMLFLVAALAVMAEHLHISLPSAGYQTFGPAVSLPAIALFGPVLEAHAVGHPRAAAWLNEHAEAHLRASLLLQKVTQLAERGVRDTDQLGVIGDLGVVLVFDHFLSHVTPLYGLI